MKTFNISPSDLSFLNSQVSVPIVSIVRYLANGTAIYGYKVPASGFTNPLTGQPFLNNIDPATVDPATGTGTALPAPSSTVELGVLGTFDLFHTSWAYFLPPVVSAAGISAAGVGEPFGLRNVQGLFNNISLPSSATWGAAYYSFARASAADYSSYSKQSITNNAFRLRTKADPTDQATVNTLAGLGSGQNPGDSPILPSAPALWGTLNTTQKALLQDSTYGVVIDPVSGNVDLSQRYANPFLTVYDYAPRMISQTVDSQAALERIEAAAPGTITDTQFYQIADINGGFRAPTYNALGEDVAGGTYGYDKDGFLVENGSLDVNNVPIENNFFKESYSRNLNTLGGDPSLTGWNVLFGQFFDHGLDFIGKGGNTINGKSSKVYIPLALDDPFYRAPVYDSTGNLTDPGYTKLSISRATVDNPDAAGADGMFHTADDIQSPGILGPTNPNYVNHTSPYIDQSQTYGSNDTVTNLLREWVETTPGSSVYTPGMKLFDGNTLTNAWTQENPDGTFTTTNKTLPTLNELRAYLLATGRDDLSWGDIDNLRVRDASGHVLDLDPVTNGLQAKDSGHTLIADFLPRIDADHLFNSTTVVALKAAPGYADPLASFDAAHIQRLSGTIDGTYISDYIDLQSGQPKDTSTFGTASSNATILNEVLLRSIGDHYVAGDGRANENFGLTAIHHVWHEDHNWQVDNLINTINQQAAGDRNLWQVAVTAQVADTLGVGVTVVAGHYEKNGNYVTASGGVSWNQEKLFQAAVLVVQTEYQHVAIDQYARGISPNIPLFVAYDSGVNSDVTLDYSQVAFRFGHSQLRETIDTLDPNGSLTGAITRYALEQAFLNPEGFAKVGPEAIAQGMTRQISNEIDEIVTPALQQKLLGQPQDLAAINIARGRDLGMPTLNNLRRQLSGGLTAELSDLQQKLNLNPNDATLRETIDKTIALQAGLQAYTSWSDFGNNLLHPEALVNFIAAYSFDGDLAKAQLVVNLVNDPTYGDPTYGIPPNPSFTIDELTILGGLGWTTTDAAIQAATFVGAGTDANKGFETIDGWNGGLAEKHVFLGELGSTFDAIFADQMTRLINGDRFYYFWRLQLGLPIFTELSSAVTTEQFKDVIERTTGAKHLVGNVFFAADSYVELGEQPADNTSTGAARDHKYGDLIGQTVAGVVIGGVYSTYGASEVLNGRVTQVGTDKYIVDNRPDIGTNPDGTAAVGFNSHEVIGGTIYKDYIDAGDGDDTIYGDAGNDTLLGNAGADHIYGEAGNDVIYGGALPDFLDGGIGDDEIHGGDDADVLIGAEGNDKIFGENFTDELHGNAGDDYLDGGLDADFIFAGEGQDVVVGGEGLDTTYGEWGDDRMFAGAGPDQLFGGYGDDILNGGAGGQNQNLNVDECLGEFGFNIVSFSDITTPLNTAADLNFQNVNLGSSTPFGQLWVDIQGIEGSGKADIIRGDANDNWLIGGGGNDTLTGGAGDDIIVGDSSLLSTLNNLTAANGGAKHFEGLQSSVPNFRFGDTVILGTSGITYVQQTVLGNDTVIYTGARANFDITLVNDPSGIVLKIKDTTGAETGPNGDIVLGVETFKFANTTFTSIADLVALPPTITGISSDTGSSTTDGITKDNTLILSGKAVLNSTVQVFLGSNPTPIGFATTDLSGNWSFDYTGTSLADGSYTFTAIAQVAGYTSAPSTGFNVTVDTVAAAPTLALLADSGLSGTDKITNSGVVTVSGLETNATWEYSINNGGAWTTGSGNSFTLTGDGLKNVLVRQTDIAGNLSSNSLALTFTLDTVAPTKTTTIVSMTKDTGTSATDFITADGTTGRVYTGSFSAVLVTNTATNNETVQVSTDGGTTWANATIVSNTNASRTWTFTDNSAHTNNWTLQSRVVDIAGNAGPVASRIVTYDNQVSAPTALTLDLIAASDSGVSATDNITNVARSTFAVTLDPTKTQTTDTIRILRGTTVLATLSAGQIQTAILAGGAVNVQLPAATPLTSGLNTLSVVQSDLAGNTATSAATLDVTLDNTAPTITTLTTGMTQDTGISPTDFITKDGSAGRFYSGTLSSALAVDEILQVSINGGTVWSNATASSTSWTFTDTTAHNANWTVQTRVIDTAGNLGATATRAVTLDASAPAAPAINTYTLAGNVNGTAEANATLLFSTSASAPTTFASTTATATGGSYSISTTGLAGSTSGTTYYLYAQDVAGNVSPGANAATQRVVVGTGGADTLTGVGGSGSDLLVGGGGNDIAQYSMTGGLTNLTGQINTASGSINIRATSIDVLTGIEGLNFTTTGYTGVGNNNNQVRSVINTAGLANNSISEFVGSYNEASGSFTFGASPSNNATLVSFDSNSGNGTNFETFLLLGKNTVSGSIGLVGGNVTLSGL
jgi:Animal haem peroxidase/Bacterial Ig-like domain/RTX calcium-binding nonapeptide repeat (4 copies)